MALAMFLGAGLGSRRLILLSALFSRLLFLSAVCEFGVAPIDLIRCTRSKASIGILNVPFNSF